MKNIMSYLLVVTFSLLNFQQALAKGDNVKSKSSGGTYQVVSYGGSCEDVEYKLSNMQFLDKPVKEMLDPSSCKVVKFNRNNVTDAMAGAVCNTKGLNALNPGNPQYIGHLNKKSVGSTTENSLGYYFCIKNNKQGMCEERKSFFGDKMSIAWRPTPNQTKGVNNGDCMCRRTSDTVAEEVRCPADSEALISENSNDCLVADAEKKGDECRCKYGNMKVVKGTEDKCPSKPDDDEFDDCFAEFQAAKDTCSEAGQAAIAKCSKEAPEVNKNISEAQRIMSIGLDALLAKSAAGGAALASCQKMSAAGTGVIGALSLLQKSCKKELETCKKGCEAVNAFKNEDLSKMREICKEKFVSAGKTWSAAHNLRFDEKAKEYQKDADSSEKFCKGDVQVAELQLGDFLDELAASVQKADICKCQLGATSVGSGAIGDNCESIMTPLTCIQNANQPGCSYSSVGCAPGSGCDPKINAANSNTSGLVAPPSGFAGPGFTSGDGGTNAGKVQLNESDFDGLYNEARPAASGSAAVDAGSPFASAGGPGGGGGGSNGGSGASTDQGAGGKEEGSDRNGLSGLFQNAKGAIASMFGGAGGDKGSAAKKSDNKGYKNDVNGFRPKGAVRGMANASEVGGKNRDIWKTMNERYTDQYHTFITVENPSK